MLSWICGAWCSSHRGAAEKSSILGCDSVTEWVVPYTANNRSAFILKVNSPRRILWCDATSLYRWFIALQRITGFIYWLLEHGDEGITTLQNVGNYTSNNTALHARRLDPSGADKFVLWGRIGLMSSQDMHISNHVIKIHVYIFWSHKLLHMIWSQGSWFFVYAEFRMINVDISWSLLCVYFICIEGCLIYFGVNHGFYVPK